jgi:hypothetical protein
MFQINDQQRIEAQLGFTWGILVGALASWAFIMFFTPWEWYFKVLSSIGEIGIVGTLLLTINELIKARRNYLDTLKEMAKMNEESTKVIQAQQEVKEDVKTLSNLASGVTNQAGLAQDDTKLQFERSASLPVDTQPLVDEKVKIGKNTFLLKDSKRSLHLKKGVKHDNN